MNPSNTPTIETKRRWLFLFDLLNREGRDLLFLRVQEGAVGRWGLHMDLDSSEPESVLVFVRTDIPADRIVHEVQKALTYWRSRRNRSTMPRNASSDVCRLQSQRL